MLGCNLQAQPKAVHTPGLQQHLKLQKNLIVIIKFMRSSFEVSSVTAYNNVAKKLPGVWTA